MEKVWKQTVRVWDELCEIDVYQKSKTVRIAVGSYMGVRIEAKEFETLNRRQAVGGGCALQGQRMMAQTQ